MASQWICSNKHISGWFHDKAPSLCLYGGCGSSEFIPFPVEGLPEKKKAGSEPAKPKKENK